MKRTSRRVRPSVTAAGEGLISHAGSSLLTELADTLGLTDEFGGAMAPTRQRRSAHDPGEVLRDLAVVLADGGDCLAHLAVLREQPDLFGAVASGPTAWRVLASVDNERLAALDALETRGAKQGSTDMCASVAEWRVRAARLGYDEAARRAQVGVRAARPLSGGRRQGIAARLVGGSGY